MKLLTFIYLLSFTFCVIVALECEKTEDDMSSSFYCPYCGHSNPYEFPIETLPPQRHCDCCGKSIYKGEVVEIVAVPTIDSFEPEEDVEVIYFWEDLTSLHSLLEDAQKRLDSLMIRAKNLKLKVPN